jgi:2-polyprenyl-6-methoxyphenol hydroxylase-like FAD-dependent oxidoreductase
MAEVLVLGAGLNGLSAAMLLALDGHRVTVLERDPGEPGGGADELWAAWERRGVNQFRQLHFMLPRWRALMERELPAVIGELEALGGAHVHVVGWACTNPSLGRGASIGLLHACALRDLLREVGPDRPEDLARRFDEVTEAAVTPLYRMTLAFDRHRLAEIAGDIAGVPYHTADASWAMSKALYAAALRDPDVLRAYASVVSMIATPKEALAGPGLLGKVIALGANAPRYPTPGPGRAELLDAIAVADDGWPPADPAVTAVPQPARVT